MHRPPVRTCRSQARHRHHRSLEDRLARLPPALFRPRLILAGLLLRQLFLGVFLELLPAAEEDRPLVLATVVVAVFRGVLPADLRSRLVDAAAVVQLEVFAAG